MKTYTFVIGSSDDFETIGALGDYVEANHDRGMLNYSVFEFAVPANVMEEDVTLIGRGYAFSNDWAMDDSFSFVIEGTLDAAFPAVFDAEVNAESEMVQAGIDAREKLKERNRSEAQAVDPYEPFNSNDPVNW